MKFNRETIVDYFRTIKDINSRNYLEVSAEAKRLEIKLQNYIDKHDNIPQNEGYIKYLANVKINIYTKKDHELLKNLLSEKGFASNTFKRPPYEKEYKSKFVALVGSDTEEGLQNMLIEIKNLCTKNDICFSLDNKNNDYDPIYGDGLNNVTIYTNFESLCILTTPRSSILLGSKVNDVINFQLDGDYSFCEHHYDLSTSRIISMEPPEHESLPKSNFISRFLDKKIDKEDEENKKEQLTKIISGINNSLKITINEIKKITGLELKTDSFIHKLEDNSVSELRAVQMEQDKFVNILTELRHNDKAKNLEKSELNKQVIKKNGFQI